MSNYVKITDYAAKDALLTGNPSKVVSGTEIGADFDAVATAVATKVDSGGALGTPSSGTLTNCTGLPLTSGVTGTLPIANGGTAATTAAGAFTNIVAQGGNLTGAINEARGTVAMHATTMDIWTSKPNILDGTGSSVTITAIANAPQAGARRTLYPIAGTVITNGATFAVDGGANYTTVSGDALEFEAVTTSTYKVHVIKSEGVNGTPAGAVMHFARNSAPSGWLKANGAAVSRTTYATLFTAIGTTFGIGDGSTTFNVPDLRGEFIRVWDDSRGIDSGRVFGSAQSQDIQPHTHTVTAMTDNATNGSNVRSTANTAVQGTSNSGSTGTTETRPRNIALLACIKY